MSRLERLAYGSLAISILVLGVKYVAYRLTGSVALYSDALESIINVATAVAAIVAVNVAARPPDAEHPYGHFKAEYLSAVVEGVLIVVAALAILREAYYGALEPQAIDAPATGLLVTSIATVMNAIWSVVLTREGRANRSPALSADGRHLMADVVTSIGVIAGVVLVVVTRIAVLDSAIAALVALHVLWNGWSVVKDSVGGLMDEAVPASDLDRIRTIIATNAEGAIEAHALRTRQAGKATFIDFHLVVSSTMSVSDAHDICDRLEHAMHSELPDSIVSIHVEPDNKAKHAGIVVLA